MDLNGKRILFIKQSSLGDVVHALPVAHAIKRKYPESFIGWVVEEGYAGLLVNDPAVDIVNSIHIPATSSPGAGKSVYWQAFVATLQTLNSLRKTFSGTPYDLVFDMHASFRSGLLSLMNRGGQRFGFADAREMNTLFHHEKVANLKGKVHALEKNFLFCEHFGISMEAGDLFLCTSADDKQRAKEFLEMHDLGGQKKFIYANPAARWETKFWPAECWALFGDRLNEAGIPVIFGGSKQDTEYIEGIKTKMKCSPIVAAGKMELAQASALIQKATAYVGLDSGPMHIAAMNQVPTIALFGPTHPERVGPYGVKNEIVRAVGVDCFCCRKRTCETMKCMKGITVDEVIRAFDRLTGIEGL